MTSSSTFTTHPCPMERVRLMAADVMILCGLTNAPSANPDTMLGELCGRLGRWAWMGGRGLSLCDTMWESCVGDWVGGCGMVGVACPCVCYAAHTLKNGGNVLIPCYPTVSKPDPPSPETEPTVASFRVWFTTCWSASRDSWIMPVLAPSPCTSFPRLLRALSLTLTSMLSGELSKTACACAH